MVITIVQLPRLAVRAAGRVTDRGVFMTRQQSIVGASLVGVWAALIVACGCREKPAPVAGSGGASEETIPYAVLSEDKRPADGKLFLDVLVNEAASRQDVMKLADRLRREYA